MRNMKESHRRTMFIFENNFQCIALFAETCCRPPASFAMENAVRFVKKFKSVLPVFRLNINARFMKIPRRLPGTHRKEFLKPASSPDRCRVNGGSSSLKR